MTYPKSPIPSEEIDRINKLAQAHGGPFKLLIVDDESWVRDVFKDFCGITEAFEVDLAHNGHQAIEMARTGQYDLVTLDLIMPEISGLEVLSAIKEATPQVKVMVITGNATDKVVHEAGILGASRVMYKPVLLERFIAEVASTLATIRS